MTTFTHKRNISYWMLAVLVISIPALVVFLMVGVVMNASLSDYIPFHNDSIYYWRQALTFSEVGFSGGHYNRAELSAPSGSRFYFHGPLYPMLYGTIASVFSWYPHSAVVVDVIVIMLAMTFVIVTLRLTRLQLVMFGLTIATYWSLNTYLLTSTQEVLHHAAALIFGVIFYRLLRLEGRTSRRESLLVILFLLFVGQLRPTWALLAFPYLILKNQNTKHGFWVASAQTLLIFAVTFGVFSFNSAPFTSNFVTSFLSTLPVSFGDALTLLLENVRTNLEQMGAGNPLYIILRFELLIFMLISGLLWTLRLSGQTCPLPRLLRSFTPREWFLHFTVLSSGFGFQLLVYATGDQREYRALAPFLLFCFLLLLAFSRFKVLLIFVLLNALLLPLYVALFIRDWGIQFQYDQVAIAEFQHVTAATLLYDSHTGSGWCNTVMFRFPVPESPFNDFPPELLVTAPPGMGISYFLAEDVVPYLSDRPIKSKYLLLRPEDEALFGGALNVELLTETSIGNLYRNLDAVCP